MQQPQAEDGLGLICLSVFGGSVSKGYSNGILQKGHCKERGTQYNGLVFGGSIPVVWGP